MKKWVVMFVIVGLIHGYIINYLVQAKGRANKSKQKENVVTMSLLPLLNEQTTSRAVPVSVLPSAETAHNGKRELTPQPKKPNVLAINYKHDVNQKIEKIVYAKALSRQMPYYPEDAREKKEEGSVTLTFQVDKYGKVANVKLASSSGFSALDESARLALVNWQFTPTYIGQDKVHYWYQQTFNFYIEQVYKDPSGNDANFEVAK